MTTADLAFALLRVNIAASAAIALVLALRGPARRWFGPHLGYGLWLLVLIAAAGARAPGPADGPASAISGAGKHWLSAGAHSSVLSALWAAGAILTAILAAWRQLRFAAAERAGRAGPAVVGIIQPRLVAPRDFAERYSAEERRLIRAHELAHVARGDARWNAAATLATWTCWFNPLAHVALGVMRLDQEMACDATVLDERPASRRAYAETLLRTSPAGGGAPLVSCLLASAHPLEMRLLTLLQDRAPQGRRDAGLAALAGLCLAAFVAAWAFQPPYPTPAEETVILIQLSPPAPTLAAWVEKNLPPAPRGAYQLAARRR